MNTDITKVTIRVKYSAMNEKDPFFRPLKKDRFGYLVKEIPLSFESNGDPDAYTDIAIALFMQTLSTKVISNYKKFLSDYDIIRDRYNIIVDVHNLINSAIYDADRMLPDTIKYYEDEVNKLTKGIKGFAIKVKFS